MNVCKMQGITKFNFGINCKSIKNFVIDVLLYFIDSYASLLTSGYQQPIMHFWR